MAEPPNAPSATVNTPEPPPTDTPEPALASPDPPKESGRPAINTRTYIVAAELYLEGEGKTAEFDAMSCDLAALAAFIKDKFGVRQLPGNFKAHKGYSYRKTLRDKSQNKKGQLKTCFHQIIDHPDVFGEVICRRAQQALTEDFD